MKCYREKASAIYWHMGPKIARPFLAFLIRSLLIFPLGITAFPPSGKKNCIPSEDKSEMLSKWSPKPPVCLYTIFHEKASTCKIDKRIVYVAQQTVKGQAKKPRGAQKKKSHACLPSFNKQTVLRYYKSRASKLTCTAPLLANWT